MVGQVVHAAVVHAAGLGASPDGGMTAAAALSPYAPPTAPDCGPSSSPLPLSCPPDTSTPAGKLFPPAGVGVTGCLPTIRSKKLATS
jgi:hypothetical protein